MFDLPTYMNAVQTIEFADAVILGVAVAFGAATMISFHRLVRRQAEERSYLNGFNDGLEAADSRGAYLDGFNDGLDTSSVDCAYPTDLISGRAKREE